MYCRPGRSVSSVVLSLLLVPVVLVDVVAGGGLHRADQAEDHHQQRYDMAATQSHSVSVSVKHGNYINYRCGAGSEEKEVASHDTYSH